MKEPEAASQPAAEEPPAQEQPQPWPSEEEQGGYPPTQEGYPWEPPYGEYTGGEGASEEEPEEELGEEPEEAEPEEAELYPEEDYSLYEPGEEGEEEPDFWPEEITEEPDLGPEEEIPEEELPESPLAEDEAPTEPVPEGQEPESTGEPEPTPAEAEIPPEPEAGPSETAEPEPPPAAPEPEHEESMRNRLRRMMQQARDRLGPQTEAEKAYTPDRVKQAQLMGYLLELAKSLPPMKNEQFRDSDERLKIESLRWRLLGKNGLHRDLKPKHPQRGESPITRERVDRTFSYIEQLSNYHPDASLGEVLKRRLHTVRDKLQR